MKYLAEEGYMTSRSIRTIMLILGFSIIGMIVFLVLTVLEDNVVYFHSPSELIELSIEPYEKMRIGGIVLDKTTHHDDLIHHFHVTDNKKSILVIYKGILPDLFREGQGVVVEGHFDAKKAFIAHNVLAKHDENYMPAEVAQSLKDAGVWQGDK